MSIYLFISRFEQSSLGWLAFICQVCQSAPDIHKGIQVRWQRGKGKGAKEKRDFWGIVSETNILLSFCFLYDRFLFCVFCCKLNFPKPEIRPKSIFFDCEFFSGGGV